jgi:hypothetical protein
VEAPTVAMSSPSGGGGTEQSDVTEEAFTNASFYNRKLLQTQAFVGSFLRTEKQKTSGKVLRKV